ncbi:hypothetical protein CC80DRAFT_495324 [Byssothecium circinans]|uniref:DUF3176 domain containing protein n=1 Tax=Byssothecium circinans TaxID=147558 RepID=A0A6A5TLD5_9PLEO|nr:hypothetical protein CC80DRAFT_495324 [Byssothecium circinans]
MPGRAASPSQDTLPAYSTFETKNDTTNRGLDIPQRIEKRLARLNASDNTAKRWAVELISWMMSAICMGIIIGILICIKDQPLSKWPKGQTVITVLAKVSAATLIIPTSEAIGQLKWNWFGGDVSKEMVDFEIFDKASRGPWGSLMLIVRTKGRSLAALGAILTLLMLAIDTFFQQVVELPERWREAGQGQISQVHRFEPRYNTITQNGAKMSLFDTTLASVTTRFLWDNGTRPLSSGNGSRQDFPMSCPTSNCTWPSYNTLGFCSACRDAPQLLEYACLSARIDWISNLTGFGTESTYPNGSMCGYFINATSEFPIMMTGYNTDSNVPYAGEALIMRVLPLLTNPTRKPLFGGSINFKHIRSPLLNVVISRASGGLETVYQNIAPDTFECVLYWCVKNLKSTNVLGTYTEETISTFTNTTPGEFPWRSYPYTSKELNGTDVYYLENVTITPPGLEQEDFGLLNKTHFSVHRAFDEFAPSFTTIRNGSTQSTIRFSFNLNAVLLRTPRVNPWLSPNNITSHMDRLAVAMTNTIRSSYSSDLAFGQASEIVVFVSVNWAWLSLPLALLVLSLLFLIATIVKTSKEKHEIGVWKTSAMPTLIYSLPQDVQKNFTSNGPVWSKAGRSDAKGIRIKLMPTKGWRVSGHVSAPTTPVMRQREVPSGWI